jgi:hypothetical protein
MIPIKGDRCEVTPKLYRVHHFAWWGHGRGLSAVRSLRCVVARGGIGIVHLLAGMAGRQECRPAMRGFDQEEQETGVSFRRETQFRGRRDILAALNEREW